MTSYTAIADTEIDAESPATEELMTRLRDNPIASSEASTGAPVLLTTWHPYDMVTYGDGNDGVIYNFGVDGGVTEVVSPDFTDGYEYRFEFDSLSCVTPAEDLTLDVYRETSASYVSVGVTATFSNISGAIDVYRPRVSRQFAQVLFNYTSFYRVDLTSAQKVLRLRFNFTATTDAGTITMYKRKVI